jgi:hypothetical protein
MTSISAIISKIGYPKKYLTKLSKSPSKYINIDSNRLIQHNTKLKFNKTYRLASSTSSLLTKVVKYIKENENIVPPKVQSSLKRKSPKKSSPKKSPKKVILESTPKSILKKTKMSSSPKKIIQKKKISFAPSSPKRSAEICFKSQKRPGRCPEPYAEDKLRDFTQKYLHDGIMLSQSEYVLFHLTVMSYFDIENDDFTMTRLNYVTNVKNKYNKLRKQNKKLPELSESDEKFIRKNLSFLYSIMKHYE